MTTAPHSSHSIIRLPELCRRTGLSRASIYNKLNPRHKSFDTSFPKQISLGARAVGFSESDVNSWLGSRIALTH
ncbi:AlpA family phage regulatory protein [Aquitalea denitrificans]|uniref:helix-turn-helix transcriptional regulator n=1 Tax=Aquitalea denitrificans TaxID=519081 RepID=UPI00135C36CB